jgi:hypothetical protein
MASIRRCELVRRLWPCFIRQWNSQLDESAIKPGASSYSILVKRRGRRQSASAEVFESDRWRQNLLILDGWCVLRFTWTMIEEHPERVVAMVRDAIRMLSNLKA